MVFMVNMVFKMVAMVLHDVQAGFAVVDLKDDCDTHTHTPSMVCSMASVQEQHT